jgi:hypothetical protein
MDLSGLAGFSLSKHLLHVGDEVTGTATDNEVDNGAPICNGADPCVTGFGWPALGTPLKPCQQPSPPTTTTKTATTSATSGASPAVQKPEQFTCTWKVVAPSGGPPIGVLAPGQEPPYNGWAIATMGIGNGIGNADSQDYYYVLGDNQYDVEGFVKDEKGLPVSGLQVVIWSSDGWTAELRTNPQGYFEDVLPADSYTVAPIAGVTGGDVRGDVSPPSYSFSLGPGHLSQEADFVLRDERTLKITFSQPNVAANGYGMVIATVQEVYKDSGLPVSDDPTQIEVEPPTDAFPPAVMCSVGTSGGSTQASVEKLAWPQVDGTEIETAPFMATTDSQGQVQFQVWVGTSAWKDGQKHDWELFARLPSQPDVLLNSTGESLVLDQDKNAQVFPPTLQNLLALGFRATNGPRLYENRTDVTFTTDTPYDQVVVSQWLANGTPNGQPAFAPPYAWVPVTISGGDAGLVIYPQSRDASGLRSFLLGQSSTTPVGPFFVVDGQLANWALPTVNLLDSIRNSDLSAADKQLKINRELDLAANAAFPSLGEWPYKSQSFFKKVFKNTLNLSAGRPQLGWSSGSPSISPLTYFGYPYPPQDQQSNVEFSQCIGTTPNIMTADVHSPVSLLWTAANGQQLGFNAAGAELDTIPGASISHQDGGTIYTVPTGSYTLSMRSTGVGKAHITITASDGAQSVYTLAVSRRQTGTLAVSTTGEQPDLHFGGALYKPVLGGKLSVQGLPPHLNVANETALHLRVVDSFGRPVVGALVTATSSIYSGEAYTGAHGGASLFIDPFEKGTFSLTVSAQGYQTATFDRPVEPEHVSAVALAAAKARAHVRG